MARIVGNNMAHFLIIFISAIVSLALSLPAFNQYDVVNYDSLSSLFTHFTIAMVNMTAVGYLVYINIPKELFNKGDGGC